MQRIQTDNGLFNGGDPSRGIPGTVVTAKWLNDVQEEIVNVILGTGVNLGEQRNQLLVAIKKFISDIPNASTSKKGLAQLSSEVNSDSEELAATPKAVKIAYTKAAEAVEAINNLNNIAKIVDAIPEEKKADVICVSTMRRNFYWQTIGGFTGYASAELGHHVLSSSATPLPGTVLADGRSLSKMTYPALFEYAKLQGLVMPASLWTQGSYWFIDQGDFFKIPDLRGQFFRAVGTDPDSANVRALGLYQGDAIRNIVGTHRASAVMDNDYATGAFLGSLGGTDGPAKAQTQYTSIMRNEIIVFDASDVVPTASENRTVSTSLNCYLYVF